MQRASMFQLVELLAPAGLAGNNVNLYFTNQPQLQSISGDRAIYLHAVEAYTNAAVPTSPLTSANPVITPADLVKCVLTLNTQGTDALQYIPLVDLYNIEGAAGGNTTPFNRRLFLLDNIVNVDWTKSYVRIVQALTVTPCSLLFGVYYGYQPAAI